MGWYWGPVLASTLGDGDIVSTGNSVIKGLLAPSKPLQMGPPDGVISGVHNGPKWVSLTRIATIILGVNWHNIGLDH